MRNKNIPLLNPCRAGRVAVVLAAFLTALSALAEDGIIRNDTVWHDAAGREIWCNGGHIIQEGEVFYWVGYDTGPGRWPWRVNLFSSRNLGDWKFENTVIRMEGKFANLGWAGRPALLHCRTTGRYVIVFEADSPRQWKRHKVGFAVCDRIDGTYELENAESPEGTRSTGDQSVYQEGDRAYVVATLDKDIGGKKYLNQSLAIFELSKDFLRIERKVFEGFDNVSGDRNRVPRDHSSREASHIINVGGVYYWFSSALVGWNSSATMFSTATNLAGPWSELKLLRTDPPSPDSYNTQHDFVLTIAGSEVTTHVYVGDRYSQWTQRGTGRNIFLPLVWQGSEPVLRWCNTWSINTATGRFTAANGDGADRLVHDAAEFHQAVTSAKPGTRIPASMRPTPPVTEPRAEIAGIEALERRQWTLEVQPQRSRSIP